MIQQLSTDTGAQGWAIGSMIFFIAVFAAVVVWVLRTPKAEHRHKAELPLEDETEDRRADSQEDNHG